MSISGITAGELLTHVLNAFQRRGMVSRVSVTSAPNSASDRAAQAQSGLERLRPPGICSGGLARRVLTREAATGGDRLSGCDSPAAVAASSSSRSSIWRAEDAPYIPTRNVDCALKLLDRRASDGRSALDPRRPWLLRPQLSTAREQRRLQNCNIVGNQTSIHAFE